jgi:hypothetical protein
VDEEPLSQSEHLAKLKEQGAISQQEYDQQKTRLNGKLALPGSKKKALWWPILAGVVIVGSILLIIISPNNDRPSVDMVAYRAREDSVRKFTNDIDVSYLKAEQAIKRNMKDPDSFAEIEHRSEYVGKKGIYISCLVQYRAKNSLGGYNIDMVLVNFNKAMEPIAIVPVD